MIVRLANYCLSSLWQRELLHAGLREAWRDILDRDATNNADETDENSCTHKPLLSRVAMTFIWQRDVWRIELEVAKFARLSSL